MEDDEHFVMEVGLTEAEMDGDVEMKKVGMTEPRRSQGAIDMSKLSYQEQRMLRAKATVERYAESYFFVGLMAIFTLWALYNDDIRLAATGKDADLAFEVVITIGFFLFLAEIMASCFYKEGYLCIPVWKRLEDETFYESIVRRSTTTGSFYFWLDIIATLSLILEVNSVDMTEILLIM